MDEWHVVVDGVRRLRWWPLDPCWRLSACGGPSRQDGADSRASGGLRERPEQCGVLT
ncbi:hypothetical protein SVIOM342S_00360 [Streptomyces violaceorubidus]